MIAAVTIEAKLITIMLLALMNIILIRRKKPAKEAIETYTLEDQHNNFNISKKQEGDSDQFERPDNLSQPHPKISNYNNNPAEEKLHHNENNHQTFFVNSHKSIKPQQQQSSSLPNNHSPNVNQFTTNQQNTILPQLTILPSNQQHEKVEQTQQKEPVNIKEVHHQPVPMDLQVSSKSDAKSDKQLPIHKQLNHRKFVSCSSTERKFIEPQYFSENESQYDFQTKKTQLNRKPKQACYNHNTTPYSIPKQTFKRCIQQLICDAVEEMVEKDPTNLGMMTKKKKRSL